MINVIISASSRYPIDRRLLRRQVSRELTDHGVIGSVEVEITLVGDRKMKFLNQKYRHINSTADVLSFPLESQVDPDGVLRLGDIVISWPQARNHAIRANQIINHVVCDLSKHGLLHLLGIHHPE